MSNTIQNYYFKDMPSYKLGARLNISIDELKSRQTEDSCNPLRIVSKDDAATIEISALARAMYGASAKTPEKPENANTMEHPEKGLEETVGDNQDDGFNGTSKNALKDISNNTAEEMPYEAAVKREIQELEEYIASHPADTSIDVLRNGSLVRQSGKAANLTDEALISMEKEYTEAFAGAAEGFADFSMKITYGAYSSNDVSANDLNFDALDKMEDIYQYYKGKIQSGYTGDDKTEYLNKLDEAYNSVFEEKIMNPVQSVYDDKLVFFRPDSEETMKSIRAASTSKEALNEMVSGYLTSQAVNKRQYNVLLQGTESLYHLADNKALWHDTAAVKRVLTDSMHVYSSVKEVRSNSTDYLSAKSAADEIAKKMSDQYADTLAYKEERLGFKKDGEDTKWSKIADAALTGPSSGMLVLDFSKIMDLGSLMDRL